MPSRYCLALGAWIGAPAFAGGLAVSVEVPRLSVAEYHRPYVALWIERADTTVAGTLAVWYQLGKKDAEGNKWLKDMRQWWRRTGRDLAMPVDGISSPTRPAGKHLVNFTEGTAPMPQLPAGEYKLVVEAARESGGREVVSIPFRWPAAQGTQLQAQGNTELGSVALELKP